MVNMSEARLEIVQAGNIRMRIAVQGSGPLVLLCHGFPESWRSWKSQLSALAAAGYRAVAPDMRGYGGTEAPPQIESYTMLHLVGDMVELVRVLGEKEAIIVGHDWGGMVAWNFALMHPEMTDKLIILNLPHPRGLTRELAHNPEQQKNSQYARNFQQPDAASKVTAEALAARIRDPEVHAKYLEAFQRSDIEAMLNYYKANYPREPYVEDTSPLVKVQAPVLMFHGLKDTALLAGALNNTWDWLDKDLTLVTVPNAGHWVQADASDLVSKTMKWWLTMR